MEARLRRAGIARRHGLPMSGTSSSARGVHPPGTLREVFREPTGLNRGLFSALTGLNRALTPHQESLPRGETPARFRAESPAPNRPVGDDPTRR